MSKTLELKLADNFMGNYNGSHCIFQLDSGNALKLSYSDCIEIFSCVADAIMPYTFDRDKILEQMQDRLEMKTHAGASFSQ